MEVKKKLPRKQINLVIREAYNACSVSCFDDKLSWNYYLSNYNEWKEYNDDAMDTTNKKSAYIGSALLVYVATGFLYVLLSGLFDLLHRGSLVPYMAVLLFASATWLIYELFISSFVKRSKIEPYVWEESCKILYKTMGEKEVKAFLGIKEPDNQFFKVPEEDGKPTEKEWIEF